MRILAIDYGDRYLGLAITDAIGIIAQGLPPLRRKQIESDLAEIQRLVRERDVGEIVVGFPRRMNNTVGPAAAKAKRFADQLAAYLGVPVHLLDERLTSVQAHRMMQEAGVPTPRKRLKEHSFAAQVILRTFLALKKRAT